MRSTGTKRKRAEKEALQYPPLVKQGRKEAEGKKRYVPEVFPEVDLPKLVLALEAHRSVVLLFLSSSFSFIRFIHFHRSSTVAVPASPPTTNVSTRTSASPTDAARTRPAPIARTR